MKIYVQDAIMSLKDKRVKIFLLIFFIFLLDQVTKYFAIKYLSPHSIVRILPFLNLVYVENIGTAFGMLKFLGSGFFVVMSSIATLVIIYIMLKDPSNWHIYSLIIAGALGNLTDRFFRGYVVDFIDIYFGNFHWPAFNIADSAITIGIVLFLYKSFKK